MTSAGIREHTRNAATEPIRPATTGGRLHFINRVDERNAGDRVASPLDHYLDYFTRFPIMRHDVRFIDLGMIGPEDVVILGGGGLLDYAEFTNRAINGVLATGASTIAWSPGFNTHYAFADPVSTPIDLDGFALLTVRDYDSDSGIPHLPDVTCKLPGLREQSEIRRTYGIARHKDHEIALPDIETITNEAEIADILAFIGETEVVISNSYHMIYWATLMGRRCISPAHFSSRFTRIQHPPAFFVPGEESLDEVSARAVRYDVLKECVERTDDFFAQVRLIVEERVAPSSAAFTIRRLATDAAVNYQAARQSRLVPGDLISSQLLIDAGEGFSIEDSVIAINNVLGDDEMAVRFDLSSRPRIDRVLFRPLDGQPCRVTIVSALSDDQEVQLAPQASLLSDHGDVFPSTDTHYVSQTPVGSMLEIRFRVELLAKPEAEALIAGVIAERDRLQAEFTTTYQHLMGTAAELDEARGALERAEARVAGLERDGV